MPGREAEFDRDSTSQKIAGAVLRSCMNQMLGNASEVASGSLDSEHIHQLRIGIRRLRTVLHDLKSIAHGFDAEWETPLIGLFRILGRYRDQGFVRDIVQPRMELAGGPHVAVQIAFEEVSDPCVAVRSHAFQDVLLCFLEFVYAMHFGEDRSSGKSAKNLLGRRLTKLFGEIKQQGRESISLEDVAQHQLRKRLKRLRYLAEFAAPLFSVRRTKSFISFLRPAQDALGVYNDELMAIQVYRTLAASDLKAWFAVGWLSAQSSVRVLNCQRELGALLEATPFWDRLKK